MANLKRLARYVAGHWPLQVATLGVTGVTAGLNLVIPLFFMLIIDRVITLREVALLGPLVLGLLGTLLLQGGSTVLRDYLFARVGQFVLRDLRLDLSRHVLRWPYSSFHHQPVGQIMARIQSDTANIHHLLSTLFVATFADIITILVAGVIVFTLNWRLSLAVIICLPMFLAAFAFFRRRIAGSAMTAQRAIAKVGEELQTMFTAIKEIKAQWAYRSQEGRLAGRLKESLRAALNQQLLQSLAQTTVSFLGSLAPVVVLWVGALEVIHDRLTIGQLVAFNSLIAHVFGPSQRLAQINMDLQRTLASAVRVFEFMDLPREGAERARRQRIRKGEVRLEDVRFSYVPGQEVLRGVNIVLPAGSRSALVGPSGSGKSTVADLMVGLYSPASGSLSIDGHDTRDLRLDSLRLQIASVPQEPVLFTGTVEENIAFARPGVSRAQIEDVARLLRIDEFCRLTDEVGERGVALSLGQRQRVGIARAVLKQPAILILDEASSGLDPETEKGIWLAVSERLKSTTILVITHRLLSVSDMDQIYFIAQGTITEHGTHSDLLKAAGEYNRMFREQFRRKETGGG